MKIYYLTRSYLPEITGGTLIRTAQVDFLKKAGLDVIVVTPDYKSKNFTANNEVIRIPYYFPNRLAMIFERTGIWEDYLDSWTKMAFEYLIDKITPNDTIFSTCGGELANIKLGSLLKTQIGCKFMINLHDPIDYTIVNGLVLDNRFHISRENQERKYIQNADIIITSSEMVKLSISEKYPELLNKIINNYFGFTKPITLYPKKISQKKRIAYGGSFSNAQSPEILAKVAIDLVNVEINFIGNYNQYGLLQPYWHKPNFKFISSLPHEEFISFMQEHIDIGFVSLANDYLGACIPSKIYEYIALGIPIIGALPDGDARDIVNKNQYGIACKYNDIVGLRDAIKQMTDYNIYNTFKSNILRDQKKWFMEERIREVIDWIKNHY